MSLPSHSLVLMYHGLSGADAAPESADPHYTLSSHAFAAQLDALRSAGFHLTCARDWLAAPRAGSVLLTFDDGDISNYTEAFEVLRARGIRADFFVNPARVGQPGYCSWDQLRRMSEAGMSIQSHGLTHTYFTHLDAAALTAELRESKRAIEQHLGGVVTLLAPPGGRSPRGLAATARALGYHAVLGSAPGVLTAGHNTAGLLPRLALTAGHDAATVLAWARGGAAAVRSLRLRYAVLAAAKAVLGDRGYERLRAGLLARGSARTSP